MVSDLVTGLTSLAKRARDMKTVSAATALRRNTAEKKKASERLDAIRKAGSRADASPEDILELSQVLCFVRNEWAAGLPFVIRSGDPGLSILAKAEVGATEPTSKMAVTDRWAKHAEKAPPSDRVAEFLSLVHPTAIVAPSARIGTGSIVCPYALVSDSASLGRFALLNYRSSLGHDVAAGDYAVLSPYASRGGNAEIESDVFMGLHASVGPVKRAGTRRKVSANSCAFADAPADSIAFGVPGRAGPRVRLTTALMRGNMP